MKNLLLSLLFVAGLLVSTSAFAGTSPFTQVGSAVALSASTTTSNRALPAGGDSVVVDNQGANDAFVAFGTSSSITASTTTSFRVPAGTQRQFNVAANGFTWMAAITGASTSNLSLVPGSGVLNSDVMSGGSVTISDGNDVTQGAKADAAYAGSGSASVVALLKGLYATVIAPVPGCGTSPCTNEIGNFTLTSQYPVGATPITASNTGTTGATTATLAGTSGKTTYICGYSIRANATAAATVTNTITGTITGTLSSAFWVAPLASGIGVDEQIFSPCIPASATNTGIAIVSGAPGTGGTVSSKGWGYQK